MRKCVRGTIPEAGICLLRWTASSRRTQMTEPVHEVSWEQLPDMPVAKWEPASLMLDDKLYV